MLRRLALLLTLALLLSVVVTAASEETLPTTWDISSVYASVDEWQADYDTVMEMLNNYEQFRGKLNNAQDIYDYLQFAYYTELTQLQNKLSLYAYLGSSLDSTDPVFTQLNAQLSAMNTKEAQITAFADPEIFSLSMEEREAIFSDPLFADYTYAVKRYTDPKSQPLGEEANTAMATISMALGYPYMAFQRMEYVEMPYPTVTMPDGTVQELTDAAYDDILHSDEYTREFKAEVNKLYGSRAKDYINTMATLLEGNAKQAYASALLSHFETTREAQLYAYDVDPSVYDMLIECAHEGIADYQRYYRAHARGLGLDEQYPFDMATYVSDFNPGKVDYDDAVAEVTDALSILGEDYIDTFKGILSSGHVDVYPNDTKTTGAFETQPSYDYLPWVLFNYNGYANDVSTIAHEMGHAMYDALTTANQPKQYRSPTIFTQEVASTTNELIYYNYKMSHASNDDEKLYYLQNALDLFTGTFFNQVLFAEFEDDFYRIVEAGGALDGEALSDRYLELLNTYRGDTVISFPETKYRWADIPHFYYVYYVYQYATSISYAASIAQGILNGEENAVENYLNFLKAGHSAAPQTLLSIAGVDPLNAETYHAAMDYFKGLVDEYERLVDIKIQNS